MMHVLLAWRWHLGSPAPLCEWLFFDRSGVEHLNCAAVHHRLRFGDKVLALSHRSDFPERDQAHDACKLNDLKQRFVFKRSEERRVGKEWVNTCRYRLSQYN